MYKCTKSINGFKHLNPQVRLEKLKLLTLNYRKMKNDLVEIYKHFHVYDKDTISNRYQHHTRTSRRHDYQLVPRIPEDGIRGVQTNSFYFRTTKPWNELLPEVVNSPNVHLFKKNLDEAWRDHPLKHNL